MSDKFSRLQQKINQELADQRQRQGGTLGTHKARQFGLFVRACMANLGKSQEDFEHTLQIEPDLAQAILNGMLPEQELDDGLVNDIARFIQHDTNILRLLLGREAQAQVNSDSQDVFSRE